MFLTACLGMIYLTEARYRLHHYCVLLRSRLYHCILSYDVVMHSRFPSFIAQVRRLMHGCVGESIYSPAWRKGGGGGQLILVHNVRRVGAGGQSILCPGGGQYIMSGGQRVLR